MKKLTYLHAQARLIADRRGFCRGSLVLLAGKGYKNLLDPLRLRRIAAVFAVVLTGFAAAPSFAQTTASSAVATPKPVEPSGIGRINQTIERIRTEDGLVRIDELRVGGEIQSVTVQPKGADGESASTALPAYEIKPGDGARGGPPDARTSNGAGTGGTSGARVWNLLKF